ncbi:acyltransferase [Candidatus Roizmanbacteria bacterium]|nr:acyltransferase [Candidatus Roizmanbacteria bacterium]
MKSRYLFIDYLRGVSIFAMIFIHSVDTYFLAQDSIRFLWNLSEFAVVTFIFCSAYLTFSKQPEVGTFLKGLQKRVSRLYYPYIVFAVIYLILLSLFRYDRITPDMLWKTFSLSGGIDIGWLVLLFLQLSIIFPLLNIWQHTHRSLFIGYGILSFASTVLFLWYPFPFDFRLIMWLPWSTIGFIALLSLRIRSSLWLPGIGFLLLYGVMYGIFQFTHHSVVQVTNKYPPNLFHLSYGIAVTLMLLEIVRLQFSVPTWIKRLTLFLSKYSYEIFFLHYLIIHTSTMIFDVSRLPWWVFFGGVLIGTIALQYVLTRVQSIQKSVFGIETDYS